MADWDDENFEPKFTEPSDKWEGEDEDDVKESWEDDDKEVKPENTVEPPTEVKAFQKKKKKKLNDKMIAEKEAARAREEAEDLSVEEKIAAKLQQQKLQETADLELAKQAFGLGDHQQLSGLDAMCPDTEEEFLEFKEALVKKITQFSQSKSYSGFIERLISDLVIPLETEDTRKIYSSVNNLYHEKQRLQKEQDKKKKKKGKAVIRAERDDDYGDLVAATEYYDEEELI